eukprot:1137168-Prorocentrum_minimum.AAC.1
MCDSPVREQPAPAAPSPRDASRQTFGRSQSQPREDFTHSLTHLSLTHFLSLTHPVANSVTHPVANLVTRSLAHSIAHSVAHSVAQRLARARACASRAPPRAPPASRSCRTAGLRAAAPPPAAAHPPPPAPSSPPPPPAPRSPPPWRRPPAGREYPQRAPIAEGKREYARSGHRSQKGKENIPVAGTDRRREKRVFP